MKDINDGYYIILICSKFEILRIKGVNYSEGFSDEVFLNF